VFRSSINLEGEHPPLCYFTPNQEVMQILIRRACGIKNKAELEGQLQVAIRSVNKEFDLLE